MTPIVQVEVIKRLKRIEGQIRGISQMVDEERYCIDIITQIGAARAALRKVEQEVLRCHVDHCVTHALKTGSGAEQKRKLDELMTVIRRATV